MMLKSHEKFYSANGKRMILIADDEALNRELLGAILEDEYEIIFAQDGEEALSLMRTNSAELSLVLLDLLMPRMGGMDVLRQIREEPEIQRVPVIVVTSDEQSEIECLGLGAMDFISKPYPQMGVIRARVQRTIELSEDRQIINSTERDPLTGLYNREFFYQYAEIYDQHHRDVDMDAIIVDINHFRIINERYGKVYADGVLRRIGEKVRETVRDTGGIVCRREADTFMIYCPHGKDYSAILENASIGLTGEESVYNRVRLRMGVYSVVDKGIDIERRFDRAKMASDTVRNSFTKTIGIYDSTLHEQEIYAEQLVEDFEKAVNEKQFKVYYQPKFNVRRSEPELAGAEALIRWEHPQLGMISPGVFIPLFEKNGLIGPLDNYVWNTVGEQVREWKDRLGITVPVSVNVSRIDLYDYNLVESLTGILEKNALTPADIHLEITESAYTEDSEQIVETVDKLRSIGFQIEMDDFGTGYSSLNMVSSLPIDALKLDMQFIRNAFRGGRDTRMIEVIIDIAEYLSVPVIAEGVETAEQLAALREMGCDIVQGYYFSRPVPAEDYERFLIEKREKNAGEAGRDAHRLSAERESVGAYVRIARALAQDYFSIYYVDTVSDHFIEYSSRAKYASLEIEYSGDDFFGMIRRNLMRDVWPEDLTKVLPEFTKDKIMQELGENGTFTLTYRLLLDGKPTYVNLKATRMEDKHDPHIVIGISNVDAQMRREEELNSAREKANRDALTGVKSKHAFEEAKAHWNGLITRGQAEPFAVAFCDLNGLKEVNDSQGHQSGDEFIKAASRVICEIFKHSPVYRIGGDEFVAILRGPDYENRVELLDRFRGENRERMLHNGFSIACGMATADPEKDKGFEAVFERADALMYEDKKTLKELTLA